MKNNFFIIKFILVLFLSTNLLANDLEITSTEVKIDKKIQKLFLKVTSKLLTNNKNILKAEEAYYSKDKDLLNSIGLTKIITSENYILESSDVIFDNKNKIIKSDYPTKIIRS